MNVERTRDSNPSNPLVALLPGIVLGTDAVIALVMWVFRVDILGAELAHMMAYVVVALMFGGVVSYFILKKTLNKLSSKENIT